MSTRSVNQARSDAAISGGAGAPKAVQDNPLSGLTSDSDLILVTDKPSWIVDGLIAIGNYLNAKDPAVIKELGAKSVLSLDGSLKYARASELGVSELVASNMKDGHNPPALFFRLVDRLQELTSRDAPVLVHCHAGRSRSVAIVAAWLVRQRGLTPDQALQFISEKRETAVAPALEALVRKASLTKP